MKQKTIQNEVSISGYGLHTGVFTNLTLKPDKKNTGIKFKRIDLNKKPIIYADLDNVFSTERNTSLNNSQAKVHTVEHILAAIIGAEIDNIIVEIDNCEIPILGGGSKEFSVLLQKAGYQSQNAQKRIFEIKETIKYTGKKGEKYILTPAKKFSITVEVDYQSEVIKKQTATLNSLSDFQTEIAKARTFCFLHELEGLLEKDLIKGGNLDNALVITDKKIERKTIQKLCDIFNEKKIEVSDSGVLNNSGFYYKNELAKHKLLDVIGDFGLLGLSIKGKIVITKPGHTYNIKFAKKIKDNYLQNKS